MSEPARAPEQLRRFGGGGVSAFGEMLVVGLVVTAASLPLITMLPAIAAGVRHFDEHLVAGDDSLRAFVRLVWRSVRSGWWFGLCWITVLAALGAGAVLGTRGVLPGGDAYAAVCLLLALGVALIGLRSAALWDPAAGWRGLRRRGSALVVEDPVGTGYVLVGLLVAGVVVWMLPPLVVITPGLVVLAAVAAERRRRARAA